MRRSNTEIQPMDRVLVDGVAHRFLGQSDIGYLFAQQGEENTLGHLNNIPFTEMSELFVSGRLVIQKEHFKSRSCK
jgi:hypothetical protein